MPIKSSDIAQDTSKLPLLLDHLGLTFLQVADGLVVVLQLQVTLAQEEVGLHRLTVQLQRVLTIRQSLVVLLQLHVAESPVGVVHRHRRVAVLGGKPDNKIHNINITALRT